MLSRLYSKFKKFIKNNYIYMLIILTVVVVFVIPVPYYIDAPGGLINLNEKIFVKDKKNSEGSFNLTYVSEMKGNVFTFLMDYENFTFPEALKVPPSFRPAYKWPEHPPVILLS